MGRCDASLRKTLETFPPTWQRGFRGFGPYPEYAVRMGQGHLVEPSRSLLSKPK